MLKVLVGNSSCQAQGLSPKQLSEVRKLMSYEADPNASYHSGSFLGSTRHLMDKAGRFPSGLLYIVEAWAKKGRHQVVYTDTRKEPAGRGGLFKLDLRHTPYPEQTSAALACASAKRGVVVAPTGVGKSVIAALIIHQLQVRTLIVVPSLELKRQLTISLKAAFGSQKVGSICDSPAIAVENVAALDPTRLLTGYDCVIIDEFHHSGAATYRKLNKKAWGNVFYRFGLTATPFRSQERERLLLESVLSKVIYRVEYQDAVDKGYIVPMEAYYYDLPVTDIQGNEMSWPSMYSELVVNNKPRNRLIGQLIEQLCSAQKSTLVLVKEVAHGKALATAYCSGDFAHGENDHTRELILELCLRERYALVGTTGVIGEGVDTPAVEFVIIADLGKSKNAFMQKVGRGFRRYVGKESCKIILFRDASHKWTLAHFKAQLKYLREEYGIEAVKLPLPDAY